MTENWSQFVPDVQFEKIPIKNLVSNQEYQRSLSARHVCKTADNFDLFQINPVKVSRRDGINYVFNGQHTIEIVARVSGSRETPVWCMVYDGLAYQTEADIFAKQQKYIKTLTPYEIFMANIEAGNDDQLTIMSIVKSYGLELSSKVSSCCICAVSALEYIYNRYGYHVLDQTLYTLVSTWEGDSFSLAANMLKAVAKLIDCYRETLKLEVFVERLSRFSAKEITRVAKERRNGSLGFAEALLTYFNKKTKYPLQWNKLYNNAGNDDEEEPESEQDDGLSDETDSEDANLGQISFVEPQQIDELPLLQNGEAL